MEVQSARKDEGKKMRHEEWERERSQRQTKLEEREENSNM